MKIYFATWMDNGFARMLNATKAKNRLISFYFLKAQKATSEQLTEYVTKGTLKRKK